jgi:hypothetical protein
MWSSRVADAAGTGAGVEACATPAHRSKAEARRIRRIWTLMRKLWCLPGERECHRPRFGTFFLSTDQAFMRKDNFRT